MKAKKVYAVFNSDDFGKKEVLCGDFKKKTCGCFDLSKSYDRKMFFTKLNGFKQNKQNEGANKTTNLEETLTLL